MNDLLWTIAKDKRSEFCQRLEQGQFAERTAESNVASAVRWAIVAMMACVAVAITFAVFAV